MSKMFANFHIVGKDGSLAILFNSMTFEIIYGNSLYQLFWRARNLHLFLIEDLEFFHILIK